MITDLDGYDWYIEFHYNVRGMTRVGTGLFYKANHNPLTKKLFVNINECHEIGNEFYVVLRRADDTYDIHDEFTTTRNQFERMTGLKALSDEEYWKRCKTVPSYNGPGAEVKIINFSSCNKK